MNIGKILNNRYVAIHMIGNGSFSEVWLSYDYKTKEYVAIKIFDNNITAYHDEIEIFEQLSKSKCKYCIECLDSFETNEYACIVQKLMVGSLYMILKKQYRHGFPMKFLWKITKDMLIALDHIHNNIGIVHTDIKPENILLVGRSIEVEQIIQKISERKFKNIRGFSHNVKELFTPEKSVSDDQNDKDEFNINEDSADENDDMSINTDSDIVSPHQNNLDRSCIISDDESIDESSDEFIDNIVVDDKYIDDPHIVLSDFGNCLDIDDLDERGDMQTRHYRAPEIILRHTITEKIDVWAMGCMLYELYTGKVLFDPHKTNHTTTDMQQLYDIMGVCGLFPKDYFGSRKKYVFFKNDFFLQNRKEINYIGLKKRIINDVNGMTFTFDEKYTEIIKCMLEYDMSLRPSPRLLLDKF